MTMRTNITKIVRYLCSYSCTKCSSILHQDLTCLFCMQGILELLSPEIVSVLENKELLIHFSVYGKCATSAQTYGDG